MSELCSLSIVYRKLKTNVVFLQSNTKPEGVYLDTRKSHIRCQNYIAYAMFIKR